MFADLRTAVVAAVVTIILAGVLLASLIINATSTKPPPALTSAAAIAVATRSLPPYWVIRPGDTFTSIARQNHLTEDQLQQLNPALDSADLVPGQHVTLHPQTAAAPVTRRRVAAFWVVAPGDTFSSIAAKSGVQVGDIATFNPSVDPTRLVPGRRLKLRP